MDTITHTLFGLTLYGAVDKREMTRREKQALLFVSLSGSLIPDIDIISAWWDTSGRYQMWHRGITHSVFLIPIWAVLLTGLSRFISKTRSLSLFIIALIAVFIHDTSDLFNAWGTGYFEPLSQMRITFGTVPIVDLVFWTIMLTGWILVRFGRPWTRHRPTHHIYRIVWLLMALHVGFQTLQGYSLYHQTRTAYEKVALSADFIPGVFTVVGKNGEQVDLLKGTFWNGLKLQMQLKSQEGANLEPLFAVNQKAKTLMEWSPFVVVVDDSKRLGIYDPRFFRGGQSFLYEYMEK